MIAYQLFHGAFLFRKYKEVLLFVLLIGLWFHFSNVNICSNW